MKKIIWVLAIGFLAFILIFATHGYGGSRSLPQCNDHYDNDGDGFCDFAWRRAYCLDGSTPGDLDCESKSDDNESSVCNVACSVNSDCGVDGYVGGLYCAGDGNVYQDYQSFTCQNPASCSSACSSETMGILVEDCLGNGCTDGQCNSNNTNATINLVKVAFIGDQGINANALAVLQLIENEGADLVLHQGDLGYGDETNLQTAIDWDNQINNILGSGFPYFASVGNHDVGNWDRAGGYKDLLLGRLGRIQGANCTGDYGVNSACYFRGIFFILSGAGTLGTGHTNYITQQLAQDNSRWSICSWHKNQQEMQVGGKTDEVGWEAYEACRQGGAIIATAHEHSYERTKNLISTEFQTVDPDWNYRNLTRAAANSTFVFVSGLGGESIRSQLRCLPTTYPYGCNGEWASIYTSSHGANYGALFCTFYLDSTTASCYFKDISGNVADRFDVVSEM